MQEHNSAKLILVVEDEEKNRTLITDVLKLNGFRVLIAVDGEEAIAHLKSQSPDIVVADINMPNFNGWKLGLWITENKKEKKIPLIFLSAMIDEEGPPKPGEFGNYYMPKPFESQRLIQKIEELITKV